MKKSFIFLLMMLIGLLLASCKTISKIETIEHFTHDTTYINKLQYDSIYVKDSIYIKEKNDTVWVNKWNTKYVERIKLDSVYVNKVDTLFKEKVETVEVKVVPSFYKGCTWAFWILLVLMIIGIVIRVLIKVYLHK